MSEAANFRAECRRLAMALLPRIEKLALNDETQDLVVVAAFRELCDRGGFLTGDRLASAEKSRAEIVLRVLESKNLTSEQGDAVLARVRDHEAEALGEVAPNEPIDVTDTTASEPIEALAEGEI